MNNVYDDVLILSQVLNERYYKFWKNIYYNDMYIYYKYAILYYKNIENNNFHNFFSGYINKKLYSGKCVLINNNTRSTFINKNNNINIPSSDNLCKLVVNTINLLDEVIYIAPTLPCDIITYRVEYYNNIKDFDWITKNKYFKSNNYLSTSINPFVYQSLSFQTEYMVIYTIYLTKYNYAYYMNIPFVYKEKNKLEMMNEYELLLPRGCIFKILKYKVVKSFNNTHKDILFVHIQLIKQEKENTITILDTSPTNILTKKQIKDIKKIKVLKIKLNNIKYELFLNTYKKLYIKNDITSNEHEIMHNVEHTLISSTKFNNYIKQITLKYYTMYNNTIYIPLSNNFNKHILNVIYNKKIIKTKYPIIFCDKYNFMSSLLMLGEPYESPISKKSYENIKNNQLYVVDYTKPIFTYIECNVKNIKYIKYIERNINLSNMILNKCTLHIKKIDKIYINNCYYTKIIATIK